MHVVGVEQFLLPLWNAWVLRGGRPDAIPMDNGEGWLLTLNGRAKFGAWVFLPMFVTGLAAVIVLQMNHALNPREFWPMLIAYSAFTALYLYYLVFCYWYRVELTEDALVLRRFLIPTRTVRWRDIVGFQYVPGDETLKFQSESGVQFGIYLSLNGLSAVRRCLAAFTPLSQTGDSWAITDPAMMERVPAWRCDEMDLEDSPFTTLGSWREAVFEEEP